MLSMEELNKEIKKLENCECVTWNVCERLATLYIIRDHIQPEEEYKDVIKYARIIADKKNPMYGDDVFDLYEMAGLLSNPLHLDTALIYLKKSVQAGNQFAACKLRRMYQEGEYVEVNLDSAYYYFKLAPDLQKWIKDTLIRSMRSESEISK